MADEELPLVDIKASATVCHATRGGMSVTFSIGADEKRKYEHRMQMANFVLAKNGQRVVRLILAECPDDWESEVDPTQGADDEEVETRWREDFARIVTHMTGHGDPPA